MAIIRVLGMDPALRNWGVALGTYDTDTKVIAVSQLGLTTSAPSPKKLKIRVNSDDLMRAKKHAVGIKQIISKANAHVIFAEVPVGSQTARAMAGYGICIGILSSLRAWDIPFIEVMPQELKIATVGVKTASKTDIIDLMRTNHPDLKWPNVKKNDTASTSFDQANHMADAIGAIYAGVLTDEFSNILALSKV